MNASVVRFGPPTSWSLRGEEVVVWESPAGQETAVRLAMVATTLAVNAASMAHLAFASRRRPIRLPAALLATSVLAHAWHYADNIWRPAAYHEPAWLYHPVLFSPMDKVCLRVGTCAVPTGDPGSCWRTRVLGWYMPTQQGKGDGVAARADQYPFPMHPNGRHFCSSFRWRLPWRLA